MDLSPGRDGDTASYKERRGRGKGADENCFKINVYCLLNCFQNTVDEKESGMI